MKYEIGSRIRAFREATGMSQKEFAAKIGVSNARVSNWEKGINRPDADTLPAICEALSISPNDLLNTPSSNQLPADALEIAKAFSNLSPAGKELIRNTMAFATKHLVARKASPLPDDLPVKRVGMFSMPSIPVINAVDDSVLYARKMAREEAKELKADMESITEE